MVKFIIYYCAILLLIGCVSCRSKENTNKSTRNDKETREKLVEVNRILIKKDQQKIKGFIARKGWNMVETETGLWYEILDNGKSIKAEKGMLATMNYTVSVFEGNTCYSSDESGPKSFLIGQGNVESGLEQGILLLSEGSKARFILPPHLAHGLPGDGKCIPARAIIIYEIELISLTNP